MKQIKLRTRPEHEAAMYVGVVWETPGGALRRFLGAYPTDTVLTISNVKGKTGRSFKKMAVLNVPDENRRVVHYQEAACPWNATLVVCAEGLKRYFGRVPQWLNLTR